MHILVSQNTKNLVVSTLFIKWLLRLRSQLFIYTKDELFASHALALARSRHTRMAFCSLTTHFVCFNKKLPLFIISKGEVYWLLRLAFEFLCFSKGRNSQLAAFAALRRRHTRYGSMSATDSFRSLCELTYRKAASLSGTATHL